MKIVDISDLNFWADKPVSNTGLPELISRLVRATHAHIKNLVIPKGKSTFRGGWDGIINSSKASEFVPEGWSAWEFGTLASCESKAEGDYAKRTLDPLGVVPAETTLIIVTPRTWEKSGEWVTEKMKDGIWKNIIVYEGGKLVEWLMKAPLQTRWLLQEIERAPADGFESLVDFWEGYRYGPSFNITPEMLVAGREIIVTELMDRLKLSPRVIPIRARSSTEAIAFVAGAIELMEIGDREDLISRIVIVENKDVFKALINNYNSFIFIPRFEAGSLMHTAVNKGHHVILPVDPDDDFRDMLDLPKPSRDGFIDALKKAGLSDEEADKISRESNRDISVIRRIEKFELRKPQWAQPANINQIVPGFLSGKWNERIEGDRQIIEKLSGKSYADYIKEISVWIAVADAPFRQVAESWRVLAPLDVWYYCKRYIQQGDLDKYGESLGIVFKNEDVNQTSSIAEKIGNAIDGKVADYSSELRKGLIETLILIALAEEPLPSVTSGQLWVDNQLIALLKNDEGAFLKFGNHELQLIAEASPKVFLNWIELYLAKMEEPGMEIFEEKDIGLMPITYLTGLLWSLEALAWFPEYLSRVVIILGKLTALDPGGQLANRPKSSLRAVFLPWNPQTYAPTTYRTGSLQSLAIQIPDVAWELCLSLLPKGDDVVFQSPQFRWRYSKHQDAAEPLKFNIDSYNNIVALALTLAGSDPHRLTQLVKVFSKPLSKVQRDAIVDHIKANINLITDTGRVLFKEIRSTIGEHEQLSTARWALAKEELAGLEELMELLKPNNDIESRLWLFDEAYPKYPGIMGYRDNSIEDVELELLNKRKDTLSGLLKEISLSGLIALMPSRGYKGEIGRTLAYILTKEEDITQVLKLAEIEGSEFDQDLFGFSMRVSAIMGAKKLLKIVLKFLPTELSYTGKAKLLSNLEFNDELLDFVELQDTGVKELYWKQARVYPGSLSADNKLYVLEQLALYQRHFTALEFAVRIRTELSSQSIYDVLKNVVVSNSIDKGRVQHYEINALFEILDSHNDLRIARFFELEWLYIPILTFFDNKRRPIVLQREMMNNPLAFIDILKHATIPRSEKLKEEELKVHCLDTKFYEFKARQCYHLLSTCSIVPGADQNGQIDYNFLEKWMRATRKLALDAERLEIADYFIGQILGRYPLDDSGLPVEEIRDIIEAVHSVSLKDNFSSSLFNQEGVTQRGVFEGGSQEREKAEDYHRKGEAMVTLWPSTSSIFTGLADTYTYSALSADNRAELMDLDY